MAIKKTPTPAKVSTPSPAKPAPKSKAPKVEAPALTIEAAVAKPARAAKPVEAAKKPTAAKASPVKKAASNKAAEAKSATVIKPEPAKVTKAPVSLDDVALRAYFISEKRRALGIPGDEHQDWIDAEREIQAEA